MTAALIHSLDQATRCGYAFGPAGEAPVRRGFFIIKDKDEDDAQKFFNLMDTLDKIWRKTKPDILVIEEPQSIAQWFQTNKGKKFPTSPAGVESGLQLSALILGLARWHGIQRVETVRRQTVLKFLVGKGNLNREDGKEACKAYMRDHGYVEPYCDDEDMCDAIAMHIYASSVFARVPQSDFRLFSPIKA